MDMDITELKWRISNFPKLFSLEILLNWIHSNIVFGQEVTATAIEVYSQKSFTQKSVEKWENKTVLLSLN